MAYSGTLCTEAEADLAIGQNSSTAQTLDTNVSIWVLMAEADMEIEFGNNIGLVANISNITSALKPWLAKVCSFRAAFYAVNQNQNTWTLATTQSKLNVCDNVWQEFLRNLKDRRAAIIDDLNL